MSRLFTPVRVLVHVRQLGMSPVHRKVLQVQGKEEFASKVLSSAKPVIVDFHADWCGPCRELGPRLEAAAEEAGLDLYKVDIDYDSELAMEYSVTAVPAVLGLANGKVIEKFIGAQDNNQITKFIQKLIDSSK